MVSAEFEVDTRKMEVPVMLPAYKQMACQFGFKIGESLSLKTYRYT